MKKSMFRCIAAMAIAALSFSVFASTSSFSTTGFSSPGFTEAVHKAASDVMIAAVAATDQACPTAIESQPIMLVHRIPSAGEQAVILGKINSIKLTSTYADREAEGRSPGERAII